MKILRLITTKKIIVWQPYIYIYTFTYTYVHILNYASKLQNIYPSIFYSRLETCFIICLICSCSVKCAVIHLIISLGTIVQLLGTIVQLLYQQAPEDHLRRLGHLRGGLYSGWQQSNTAGSEVAAKSPWRCKTERVETSQVRLCSHAVRPTLRRNPAAPSCSSSAAGDVSLFLPTWHGQVVFAVFTPCRITERLSWRVRHDAEACGVFISDWGLGKGWWRREGAQKKRLRSAAFFLPRCQTCCESRDITQRY